MNLPEKDISFAKEFFLEYEGDHYFMMRDNLLDMYRQFQISDAQEFSWAFEEESRLLNVFLSRDPFIYSETRSLFSYLVRFFVPSIACQINGFLQPRLNEMCTFTKILFSQKLLKVFSENKSFRLLLTPHKRHVLWQTKKLAQDILQMASQQEFHVDDRYRKWPGFNENDFSEDRLRERIRRMRAENKLFIHL